MRAPQQFDQIVRWDRQGDVRWAVLWLPADVFEQAEVFAELDPQPLSLGEVLLLDRDPEVADPAEVVKDELVERVSAPPVDRSGRRREAQGCRPAPARGGYRLHRIEGSYFGAGPRGVARRRGRYLVLSAANVGGRDARLKVCRRTSLEAHVAPGVAPWRFSAAPRNAENPANPLPKRDSAKRA